MASGSQKVKTPTGWNATRGAWVKTASGTWKDVDQIYIKTTGWNNASGQESVQQISLYRKWSRTKHKRCTESLSLYCKRTRTKYQVGTTTLSLHCKCTRTKY